MKKFKTVKQAFENGYRIRYIDYSVQNQEWYVAMSKDSKELHKGVYFFYKQLPKYLEEKMFFSEIHEVSFISTFSWIKTKIELPEILPE